MKLKSFENFEPINKLREKMGAKYLGLFELFDPKRQITFNEKELLAVGQLKINILQIKILKDKTIAFKNTRLWLSWDDHECYHLAACEQVQKRRHLKADFFAGVHQEHKKTVCLECLKLLQYEGLDARRSRRIEISESIQQDFDLLVFQEKYPASF